MRKYNYRMFYMEPPILKRKRPEIEEFKSTDFDSAYGKSKEFIKAKAVGTQILMLAQLNR